MLFVRTVYATGDPAQLGTAIRVLNTQGHDLLEERPGFRGAGVFVDRDLGTLLSVSWWESAEARDNSDEVMRERRPALLQPFAGTVAVENYEATVFPVGHRPLTGGGMRLTRLEFAPADADLAFDTFHAGVLPHLEVLPGFAGAALFLDRGRGRGMTGVLFADRDALAASRSRQAAVRREGVAKAHVAVVALEEFEIVHADVRTD
jgi:heme-degrading monooxygenase HmoA